MDPEIVFRILFVLGIMTIPVLYWFFGRGAAGQDENKAQSEAEGGKRERQSEEHSSSQEDTD